MAVAMFVLLLPLVWLFIVYNGKHRVCVSLENGLNLGYAAVFDLGRPWFRPIVVPRLRNGTPLIHDETWAIFVTDTTLYGSAMGPTRAADYRFAWRADTGLIRWQDDPARHDALIAGAGPANRGIGIGSVDAGWLYAELLRQHPARDRCPTGLLTW